MSKDTQETICSCFHTEYGKDVCWGTKEKKACSCNGDENKCDFYSYKRKEKPTETNDNVNHPSHYNQDGIECNDISETKRFQRKLAMHEEICRELHELYANKNADYGDSVGKTYQDFGIVSFATRISDKYNRMVALVKGHKPNIVDEKLEDTLRDMANYCLLAVLEMEMEKDG